VKSISLLTATCIVIADMIGTGIFTSLGFQVGDLKTGFSIMALWFVGGICAMCGALSYAELGAALPRSGGEYHFLSKVYHPSVGFLAGWVSATVGFAAPVALAAMAFGKYLTGVAPGLPSVIGLPAQTWLALLISGAVTLLLLRDVKVGSLFQDGATFLKIGLILLVIGAGLVISNVQPVSFFPAPGDGKLIGSAPFAVSLVYVMYAYSGWNASTYLAGELRDPSRTIPLSVGIGTGVVMLCYLLVNAVFLRSTPIPEMVGKEEVGLVAGAYLFGPAGAKVMAVLICIGLVSAISAMMWIGPRVTMAMGEDFSALRWLGRKTQFGIPATATLVQFGIVVVLLLTSTFQAVLTYVQFALQVCSFLTVLGVIILRKTQPNLPRPYKTWGYPVTPILFLSISAWMLVHIWRSSPKESMLGMGTLVLGLLIYFLFPSRPGSGDRPSSGQPIQDAARP
jgi:APA family basic amino acid/polyamine antiporter